MSANSTLDDSKIATQEEILELRRETHQGGFSIGYMQDCPGFKSHPRTTCEFYFDIHDSVLCGNWKMPYAECFYLPSTVEFNPQ